MRHLCIPFLNTLTLLACTQSIGNSFHSFTVLWENKYFPPSALLFHHRQVVSSSSFVCLIMKKKILGVNIFITIRFCLRLKYWGGVLFQEWTRSFSTLATSYSSIAFRCSSGCPKHTPLAYLWNSGAPSCGQLWHSVCIVVVSTLLSDSADRQRAVVAVLLGGTVPLRVDVL